VQVGRERGAVEVLADLRRLEGRVKLAGMTAVLNAESALNDLRDAEDDPASYVRAAGQALITHLDTAPSWSAEALRRRVAELQPKAVVVEDQALAAENIRGQIARVRAEQAVA
jgi:G3E family GTPase